MTVRWTAKGPSRTYTCVHSPPNPPPIQATTHHWAEFYVLYCRLLLAIHFKHSRTHWTFFLLQIFFLLHPLVCRMSQIALNNTKKLTLFCYFIFQRCVCKMFQAFSWETTWQWRPSLWGGSWEHVLEIGPKVGLCHFYKKHRKERRKEWAVRETKKDWVALGMQADLALENVRSAWDSKALW